MANCRLLASEMPPENAGYERIEKASSNGQMEKASQGEENIKWVYFIMKNYDNEKTQFAVHTGRHSSWQ
jgi:hypothetical protein